MHVRTYALTAVALIALPPLAGCGEQTQSATSNQATEQHAAVSRPARLVVSTPDDGATVHRGRIVARGSADPEARVTVNGAPTTVDADGSWSHPVHLELGGQTIEVVATQPGHTEARQILAVTRRRSAAELAELRRRRAERARQRQLARQQAEANFKASATTIPYKQLEKNADAFKGRHVVFRGEIFQIQESTGGGGIMLVSVTDEGYGIWDDHVWVDYDGHVKGAEGDMVTVYGTMTGSKSYETQIGGETYVPRMHARYVVE